MSTKLAHKLALPGPTNISSDEMERIRGELPPTHTIGIENHQLVLRADTRFNL